MNIQHQRAITWIESRAAENTASPEDNAVLGYLIRLVEADAKKAPIVDEVSAELQA